MAGAHALGRQEAMVPLGGTFRTMAVSFARRKET
jgi:hypothetical protein